MIVTYLIFVHDRPDLLKNLICCLSSDSVRFFIHIDLKSVENFDFLNKYDNVHVSEKRYSIEWGGFSMVEALIYCCEQLLNHNLGNEEMVCFLSGYDYPVKSNEYIYKYLEKYCDKNFICGINLPHKNCNWLEHGRRRIECYALHLNKKSIATIEPRTLNFENFKQIVKVLRDNPCKLIDAINLFLFKPKRMHPAYLKPYGGEFWWVLPISTIATIINYVHVHPDFVEYHRYTSNPDEVFFPTLVYNLFPPNKIVNTCLRFINWHGSLSPKNIDLNDLMTCKDKIEKEHILFVRKVADLNICKKIDSLYNK